MEGIARDSDFQQCLKQYATAALGLAGVSALAAAQVPAHHILYTPANIPLYSLSPTTVAIDFNHDGITDVTITVTGGTSAHSGHGGATFGFIYEAPAPGNLAIGGHAIPQGVLLTHGGAFKSSRQRMAYAVRAWGSSGFQRSSSGGPFKNAIDKYLGVEFQIGGKPHYGWIRISLTCGKGQIVGTISGYAYETRAGYDIAAGQLRSTAASTKEAIEKAPAGSLGMLAVGSSAIPYWRK